MIALKFFKDGVYIYGHDKIKVCTLVSYAIHCAIEDCLEVDNDIEYYESGYDENNKYLGYSYLKINEECGKHIDILNKLQSRMKFWLQDENCAIHVCDSNVDYEKGLLDARGYIEEKNRNYDRMVKGLARHLVRNRRQ